MLYSAALSLHIVQEALMEQTKTVKNETAFVAALAIGAFIATMNMTNINIALPFIISDFQSDMGTIQWVVTGCMLTCGLIMPTVGYFMDRYGGRNLFLAGLTLLAASSLLCALSGSVTFLIISRLLQGFSIGIINTIPMAIVYQVLAPEKQLSAISIVSMVLSVGVAMGPSLSGVLVDIWGWQAIFLVNIPIAVLDFYLIYQFVPQKAIAADQKLDSVGLASSAIGTVGLLVGFSQGDTLGWTSPITIVILAVSIISLVFFVCYEMKKHNPMLNFSVFLYRGFVFMFVLNAVSQMATNIAPMFMSLFLQNVSGYNATAAGLAMIIPSLAMAVMAPVAAKSKKYFSSRTILLVSMTALAFATWQLSRFTIATTIVGFTIWMSLRYASMGLMSPIISNFAMTSLPTQLTGHASAMMNWSRQLLSTISMSLFSIFYGNRLLALSMQTVDLRIAEQQAIGMVNGISAFLVALTIPLILFIKEEYSKQNQ